MSEFASPTLFDDGKAAEALRTIGEVANALHIRQHVLRYWEEQFPMLRPLKRGGGRRYYRPDDVMLVESIDRLVHRDGYTLRGARLVLEGNVSEAAAERSVAAQASGLEMDRGSAPISGEFLPQLQAIRARLGAALDD